MSIHKFNSINIMLYLDVGAHIIGILRGFLLKENTKENNMAI